MSTFDRKFVSYSGEFRVADGVKIIDLLKGKWMDGWKAKETICIRFVSYNPGKLSFCHTE